ncbi:MAG: hypothetical protein WB245_02060 [Acidimicrobiia bacterium]
MSARLSKVSIALAMSLVLGACASGQSASDTTESAEPTTDGTTETVESTTSTTAAGGGDVTETTDSGSSGVVDGSDIDWATVDLATIDWENIDLRTVDFEAAQDNPTAANLTADMQAVISSRLNPGNVTLTIGDMTWEFDNFLCAVGLEATQSDTFSLSTNTFGEIDGTRIQLQANIEDDSGQGRLGGDGLTHEVFVDDIENFDNPAVSWKMVADQGIVLDGYELSAEGVFDDAVTGDSMPGTLMGTCGDQSRMP